MINEIVSFRFVDDSTPAEQEARLELLGRWVRQQPGFVARVASFDPHAGRWLDHVTWTDLASARAAMERSMGEPELAGVMATIDQATMSMGHYEQRLRS
jgi:hypothetical protein